MYDGIPFPQAAGDLIRLGYAYEVCLGKMLQSAPESTADFEVPYLKAGHVRADGIVSVDDLPTMFCNARELAKFSVREGDLLVCEGGDVGRAAILTRVPPRSIIQNALHRVRDRAGSVGYLRYVLQHLAHAGWFDVLCNKATIAHLTQEKLEAIRVPLPAITVQRQMTALLDRKTAAIDALISKKECLIELLQEKRQARITQAVTKGLNPAVPMKDSGIDWIGRIPQHWSLVRLKYLVRMTGGFAFSSEAFADDGVQLLRIGNLYERKLQLDRDPVYLPGEYVHTHRRFLVRKDDLLMSLTGTLGKQDYGFAVRVESDKPLLLNQRVGCLRCGVALSPRYALRLLQSDVFLNPLYSMPFGTKQANLGNDDVLGVLVPVPPRAEQESITVHLESALLATATTEDALRLQIDRLLEYRQALITAVVTGRFDVSKEAA